MKLSINRRNEIAWPYLIRVISKRKFELVSVENLHTEICALISQDHPFRPCCWSFVNDLIDSAFLSVQGKDPSVSYRVNESKRLSFAYDILLQIMLQKGLRISSTTKREVGNLATELNIPTKEVTAFVKILYMEVLTSALE